MPGTAGATAQGGWVRRHITSLFLSVLRSSTRRITGGKMAGFGSTEIFTAVEMRDHFTHLALGEVALQDVVKGLIIDRIRFIRECLGDEAIGRGTFADIGDPNGIFLRALGKDGLSANISEPCVKAVRRKGMAVVRCDAEHLPFRDASLDHILFFEILEHLPNPVAALGELARVTRISAFISIPYLSGTLIHRYGYDTSVPPFENHIFEFSDADFRRIVSHTGFGIARWEQAEVVGRWTVTEYPVFLLWKIARRLSRDPEYPGNADDLFMGVFRRFQLYHLVKK